MMKDTVLDLGETLHSPLTHEELGQTAAGSPLLPLPDFSPWKMVVNPVQRVVRHANGQSNRLSALEFKLLSHLARKAGTVVSRAELLSCVWRLDPRRTQTRTVDMHVS